MNAYPEKQHYTADDLAAIIAILRDPDNGCPWDKVQTHRSIRMNFLEEAYEAVDAIDLDDPELLCEELGDVLMQVVFHAQIEREAGHFTFAEVCDGVCRKLLDRHPHIFRGDESIKDWDSLKNKEKGRLTLADDLESVPGALPALMRAAKLQKRAARCGVETAAAPADIAAAAGGHCAGHILFPGKGQLAPLLLDTKAPFHGGDGIIHRQRLKFKNRAAGQECVVDIEIRVLCGRGDQGDLAVFQEFQQALLLLLIEILYLIQVQQDTVGGHHGVHIRHDILHILEGCGGGV